MHRSIIGGAMALALSLALGAASARAQGSMPPGVSPAIAAQLQKVEVAGRAGDGKAVHEELSALTHMSEFAALPPQMRAGLLQFDAQIAAELGLADYALASARSAAKLPGHEGLVTEVELLNAIRATDAPAQRRALKTLATQHPTTLADLPDRYVLTAFFAATPDATAEAEQGDIAEILLTAWRPQDPFQSLDGLKLSAAQRRLATGHRDTARQLADTMETPSANLTVRTDRRFDGLFGADSWALPTPRAVSEAYLARTRTLRRQYPRRLTGASSEASILLGLRAGEEALQVIETALADAERNPSAFSDTAQVLSRIKEQHAIILDRLRRYDESKAIFRQGAALREAGVENVSQVLDLSTRLIDDDPAESIRLTKLALGRDVTGFGRAVGLRTQVCAYVALGQPQEAQAAYAELLAMKAPGIGGGVENAATCMKDKDRVAASLIASLKDPGDRRSTISRMQVNMPVAYPPRSPRLVAEAETLREVVLRPDVQAALEPYGRLIALKPEELWLR